jgi:RNA polymerase sigma-70 factor (ECF subfamily)
VGDDQPKIGKVFDGRAIGWISRTKMELHAVGSLSDSEEANGRPEPLDRLYAEHASDVRRWARRLAGPRADLEDLVHDVFVIALRRRFVVRREANVTTWLFRVTENVVRSRMRRGFVRRLLFNRHQETLVSLAPSPSTPHEEVERRERHVRLYRALDQLPDCYRTAVILYEIEGLSGEEVAKLTGTSLGTVWVRLHRGRAKLLEVLDEEERP